LSPATISPSIWSGASLAGFFLFFLLLDRPLIGSPRAKTRSTKHNLSIVCWLIHGTFAPQDRYAPADRNFFFFSGSALVRRFEHLRSRTPPDFLRFFQSFDRVTFCDICRREFSLRVPRPSANPPGTTRPVLVSGPAAQMCATFAVSEPAFVSTRPR